MENGDNNSRKNDQEVSMKKAKDDKRISTIPDGVYEAGVVGHGPSHEKNSHENTPSTDAQGNGYPMHDSKNRTGR